jgi:hypothetical protein
MVIKMKVKDVITNTRLWKKEYLNLDLNIANKRKEYCRKQTSLGRKDHYTIYTEAKRLFR